MRVVCFYGSRSNKPEVEIPFYNTTHRHRMDKYPDTLLANQIAQKALPPTIAKNGTRKRVDCPS